jgi:hypothetical protein
MSAHTFDFTIFGQWIYQYFVKVGPYIKVLKKDMSPYTKMLKKDMSTYTKMMKDML